MKLREELLWFLRLGGGEGDGVTFKQKVTNNPSERVEYILILHTILITIKQLNRKMGKKNVIVQITCTKPTKISVENLGKNLV